MRNEMYISNKVALDRESRYSLFLRGKNATGRADGKTEKVSIGQLRRSLIDPLTKERQVAIEGAIIEGTQFHMHQSGIAHDATRKSEKRNQPEPASHARRK